MKNFYTVGLRGSGIVLLGVFSVWLIFCMTYMLGDISMHAIHASKLVRVFFAIAGMVGLFFTLITLIIFCVFFVRVMRNGYNGDLTVFSNDTLDDWDEVADRVTRVKVKIMNNWEVVGTALAVTLLTEGILYFSFKLCMASVGIATHSSMCSIAPFLGVLFFAGLFVVPLYAMYWVHGNCSKTSNQ